MGCDRFCNILVELAPANFWKVRQDAWRRFGVHILTNDNIVEIRAWKWTNEIPHCDEFQSNGYEFLRPLFGWIKKSIMEKFFISYLVSEWKIFSYTFLKGRKNIKIHQTPLEGWENPWLSRGEGNWIMDENNIRGRHRRWSKIIM